MCGKSRKHSFNTEVIVDSSISRAWTPHAIPLSDRNDPLWEWLVKSDQSEGIPGAGITERVVYKRNDCRLGRPRSPQFPSVRAWNRLSNKRSATMLKTESETGERRYKYGLSVLHTWYSFEIPASPSQGQLPLAKFRCKLSPSCQVMFSTSHSRYSVPWWIPKAFAVKWRMLIAWICSRKNWDLF